MERPFVQQRSFSSLFIIKVVVVVLFRRNDCFSRVMLQVCNYLEFASILNVLHSPSQDEINVALHFKGNHPHVVWA